MLATTGTVEYFHTGNLVDPLSALPWKATAKEERNDADGTEDIKNPLFLPPPEELSVSLYLEGDPEEATVVLAVPRWFSDGEVWEVRRRSGRPLLRPSKLVRADFVVSPSSTPPSLGIFSFYAPTPGVFILLLIPSA